MDFTVADIGLIAVIVGLVEVVKMVTPDMYREIVARISPVISLALGIIAGIVYLAPNDPKMAVLSGIVMGLSASGLYSGSKAVIGK